LSEFGQRPDLRLLRPSRGTLPLDALDLDEPVIQGRFEWAIRQGHPGYLWPDVPIHAWRACLFELERVVAWVLAGEQKVRLELPRAATARALGIAAFTSGVGPLLGHWLESGLLEAEPDVRRLLGLHLEHNRLRTQRISRALDSLLRTLATVQVPVIIVKGGYTSSVYFADPAVRPVADVDVVIRPSDVGRATTALEGAGYRASVRQSRPYKCDWLPLDAPRSLRSIELTHYDNGFSFEVHVSLDRVFDGVRTIALGRLDEHAVAWPQRGRNAFRLREPAGTALLALHMSEELHQLQLIRLIELVLVLRREYTNSAQWADLSALLERSRAEAFVYPAFELAERLAPGCVDADFRRYLAGHAHSRLVRVVDGLRPASAHRVERLSLEERLLWARGPWQTLRRLAYLAWPTRAGRSRRPLRAVYRERWYRLVRGRLGLSDRL
jgi:hypothetical protein